jgi:hypothetical protein
MISKLLRAKNETKALFMSLSTDKGAIAFQPTVTGISIPIANLNPNE